MRREQKAVSVLVAVAVCYSSLDVQNSFCKGLCQMSGHALGGYWETDQCVCKVPMHPDTVRFPVLPRKLLERKHPPGWSGKLELPKEKIDE